MPRTRREFRIRAPRELLTRPNTWLNPPLAAAAIVLQGRARYLALASEPVEASIELSREIRAPKQQRFTMGRHAGPRAGDRIEPGIFPGKSTAKRRGAAPA